MPTDLKNRSRLANQQKAALVERLGGRCVECGSIDRLQIDHPYGRDWVPRKVTHYARVRRYLKEEALGLIRLLCMDCNQVIRPNRAGPPACIEGPF